MECEYCERAIGARTYRLRLPHGVELEFCHWGCRNRFEQEEKNFRNRMIFGLHSVWTRENSPAATVRLLDALLGRDRGITSAALLVDTELSNMLNRRAATSFWGQGRGSTRSIHVL
jgi:hypothetical protein